MGHLKTIPELLAMDCSQMVKEIKRVVGRDLSIREELQVAIFSGAYKTGSGVTISDLYHPAFEVSFPEYLRALGYPVTEKPKQKKENGKKYSSNGGNHETFD